VKKRAPFLQESSSSSVSSPLNLQESLLEFSQLQDRIKKEQEQLLDSRLSIDMASFGSGSGGGCFASGQSPLLLAAETPSSSSSTLTSGGGAGFGGPGPASTAVTAVASRMHDEPPTLFTEYEYNTTAAATAVENTPQTPSPSAVSKTATVPQRLSSGFKPPAGRPSLPAYPQLRQPPPPAESSSCGTLIGPSSPFSIKLEPGTELASQVSSLNNSRNSNNQGGNSNNTILKQFLQDTSFQTKFNLKPFDLGGGLSGFMSAGSAAQQKRSAAEEDEAAATAAANSGLLEVKIEPVLDMAVQQVQKDIDTTCEMLSISKG
jgi:hypothetical protein